MPRVSGERRLGHGRNRANRSELVQDKTRHGSRQERQPQEDYDCRLFEDKAISNV